MGECSGVITDGRQRWDVQPGGGVNIPLANGATDRCSQPGALQFSFVLPSNVVPSAVDITGQNKILLRIML